MEREQLEEIVGRGAMIDYEAVEEWARPALQVWASTLRLLTDGQLLQEARSVCADSLIASSQRLWRDLSHVKVAACMFEAQRRHRMAGHTEHCDGDTLYAQALADVTSAHGYEPGEPTACTCGKAKSS